MLAAKKYIPGLGVDFQIQPDEIGGTLGTGTIQLPLAAPRILSAADYQNTAGAGGVLSTNTAPSIARVNGATDPSTRISWAATVVAEIQWDFDVPDDLDESKPVVVHAFMSMAAANDTPVVAVKCFIGVGGTDLGGNTTALNAVVTDKTRSLTFPATPQGKKGMLSLTPAAHGTDILRLDGIRLVYTRK